MRPFILILMIILLPEITTGKVKLPSNISDNMLIQRNRPVKLWGWAEKKENVSISFNSRTEKTKTDKHGIWEITLPPMSFGWTYSMIIQGKDNEIILNNILIGDIWLCSGQSNMEWPVGESKDAKEELERVNYTQMRLLSIKKKASNKEEKTVESDDWQVEKDEIIIKFKHIAEGLVAKDKYGYLKRFSIADVDKMYIWAKAYIHNNEIIVYNEKVSEPVFVRYAWGNDPHDVNLCNNTAGLSTSHFNTDNKYCK